MHFDTLEDCVRSVSTSVILRRHQPPFCPPTNRYELTGYQLPPTTVRQAVSRTLSATSRLNRALKSRVFTLPVKELEAIFER